MYNILFTFYYSTYYCNLGESKLYYFLSNYCFIYILYHDSKYFIFNFFLMNNIITWFGDYHNIITWFNDYHRFWC